MGVLVIHWRGVLLHHSATDPDYPWEGITAYHVAPPPRGRGWRDVGYHWGIAQEGGKWVVRKGRPESMVGAHCPTRNAIELGVCLVGNFTAAAPPTEQLEVAAGLCADLCERWEFLPSAIRAHRTFRRTECPGRAFTDPMLIQFRERVMQLLIHG